MLVLAWCTILPTASEPVKKMRSHRWASSACVSGMAPSTTRTARGSRYAGKRRASSALVLGVNSEGLSTTQLPAASALRTGTAASCAL